MRNGKTTQGAELTTPKDAAARKRGLGREPGNHHRGFGFEPHDGIQPRYTQEERSYDAATIFIDECAVAYCAGKLDQSYPKPPATIGHQVRKFGGSVSWLSASRDRRERFYRAYCRQIGRDVPYTQVWKDHA